MVTDIPKEFKIEFLSEHPNAVILEYKLSNSKFTVCHSIYYKDGFAIGVYSKDIFKDIDRDYNTDRYLYTDEINKLIELCKIEK